MIAEAFVMCWNEQEIIDMTIRHYQRFCDKVTLLDNHSTDQTVETAEEMGCEIIQFGRKGELDDREYLKIKNSVYRKSKSKYVIVVDADEILHHPEIRTILENDTGNIFNTIGWDVFSEEMPLYDFLEIQTGIFSGNYCKKVIFSPKIKINYNYGCHICQPEGRINPSNETLTLFHYRNIGGYERLSERHKMYRERLSENNKSFGLGCHYSFPEEQRKREWYEKFKSRLEYRHFDPVGVDIIPF